MFEIIENVQQSAKIKVIGVGGGGGNAINAMIDARLEGVEFIAANTDAQALRQSKAHTKIQLGVELTKGLGAGSDPELGRNATLESREQLRGAIEGADMVFVTAGLGGGTGTGGSPIIAEVARDCGVLTVAVVTKPFMFEGPRRMRQAEDGFREIKKVVDTVISIPNQRLLNIAGKNTSILDAFKKANEVLLNGVKGISDLIIIPGLINLDFADVRTVMREMGMALMGMGVSEGENRAVEAAQQAISSPLLEDLSIQGAKGVLINITGSPNLTLYEVNEAASLIHEAADKEANILFGAVIDEKCGEQVRVTVIATGFGALSEREARPSRLELIHGENLERPAFERRINAAPLRPNPALRSEEPLRENVKSEPVPPGLRGGPGVSPFEGPNYDIPAFLRKQAD